MRIARPASGFIISEPATFAVYLQNYVGKWPRVLEHWAAVKDRLKMTAHKEGAAVGGNVSYRVFEAEGDAASGWPTIRVAYQVLGDKLDFRKIIVLDPPQY
jgi:hypothetical protein